eukprot:TRINITY_DN7111_c0_g1_i5.p1 TRINITY_DN7111_c0_g1~~TRINITY_DN7111_c0_g1_i5.p1  ORF type:complete len:271 (-),score=41.15 TRINITY_DN7111_c0_g1_i5:365-1177(-)
MYQVTPVQWSEIFCIPRGKEMNYCIYALILAGGKLVNLVGPKKHILYPPDLHLLINFVNCCRAFKESDASLTPICLPTFNNAGFLHLYVCYLAPDICLLLLSSKAEEFPMMSKTKDRIAIALNHRDANNNNVMSQLKEGIRHHPYNVSVVGEFPELVHFLYKAHNISQMTAPDIGLPFHTDHLKKRLYRIYQQVHNMVHQRREDEPLPIKIYFHRSESEIVLAWIANGFDLYTCFSPLTSKPHAIRACNSILKWIKAEENNLFILSSPVW